MKQTVYLLEYNDDGDLEMIVNKELNATNLLKSLCCFTRDRVFYALDSLNDIDIYKPREGILYYIGQDKEVRYIKSKEQFEQLKVRDDVTLKIHNLHRLSDSLTECIYQNFYTLVDDFISHYPNNEVIRLFDYMVNSLGGRFTLECFYGKNNSNSFDPHVDGDVVVMAPIRSETMNDYKTVHFFNQLSDKEPKFTINIRHGDIVMMGRNTPHEVKYHGETDMVSIAIEKDYLSFIKDEDMQSTVRRLFQ